MIRVVICLVVGVFVNIAIAWALAMTIDVHRAPPIGGMALFEQAHWSTQAYRGLGSLVATSAWRYGENPGQTANDPADYVPEWMPDRDANGALLRGEIVHIDRTIEARGWPMLSLWSSVRWIAVDHQRHIVQSAGVEGGIVTGISPWITVPARGNRPALTRPRVLPLRPVWPGFAVNSVGLGLVLWLAIFGWRDARAMLRMRGRKCVACGYPVGQSPRCSECGAAVRGMPITPQSVR